jgi:hypothetical protein
MYSWGGTYGVQGCGVVYRSDATMLGNVSVTAPSLYTSQTAPSGTTNTGAYTVPSDQGSASDVASSDTFIAPGSLWTALTPKQKAAVTILVLRAYPDFVPIADEQTMPDCVGLSQSECDAALDGAAATGTRTYSVADPEDADLAQPAGAVIAQTVNPETSFDRAADLAFTTNPDPLPSCVTTTENPHWSTGGNTVVSKANLTCNFSGTVPLTMTMWKCTSSPSADAGAVSGGSWGCSSAATTDAMVPVEPGIEVDPAAYCPEISAPLVSGNAYFITQTTNPYGPPSWSQEDWYVTQP